MGDRVTHFEIIAKDAAGLQAFYRDAFDWKIDADNPMSYGLVDTGGEVGGGIGGLPDDSYPGHLTFYVEVADLDEALARVEKLGGKRVMDPDEVPGGPAIAQFQDPAGNLIGLVKAT